jgi:hypothetical protein
MSLPQLIHYKELFYTGGKKIVPLNIEELMTPAVLAHLIMGDGNLKTHDKIIRIYTNSFTKEEVESLASSITNKLNIQAKATHDRNNQYMITISKSELSKVQEVVKDHMHPSMFYKIDLEKDNLHKFNYDRVHEFDAQATVVGYNDILYQFEK